MSLRKNIILYERLSAVLKEYQQAMTASKRATLAVVANVEGSSYRLKLVIKNTTMPKNSEKYLRNSI
jgi:hypothetical protein